MFPGDVKTRAIIRRLILEVDNYYYAASEKLLMQALFTKPEERDAKAISDGREALWSSSATSPGRCGAITSPARCRRPTSRSIPWSRC